MGVIGLGVDVADVDRVQQAIDRHPDRFPRRVFTEAEVAYCRRGARPAERFAARFAAKEAVMKALGSGWGGGVTFRDIEVLKAASGAPAIRLHGEARARAERQGVARIDVSLTHARGMAVAVVVFSGEGGR